METQEGARSALEPWGWDEGWARAFAPHAERGLEPGRVVMHQRLYRIRGAEGEWLADTTGRMRRASVSGPPAVGDWVAVAPVPGEPRARIQDVLPRRTHFARIAPGERGERGEVQVLVANLDTLFVVTSFGRDLNPRRLERYLTLARDGGAEPVILVNKADLAEDPAGALAAAGAVAAGAPVHAISASTGAGLDALASYLQPGRTVALLGSSGVGKSTLINRLLQREAFAVGAVRAQDDRGRHTTTHRELVRLPGGALLVDTPGLRELHLLADESGLQGAFPDLEALAAGCRFRDCRHDREPGCAVRAAVEAGALAPERLAGFQKLSAELEHREAAADAGAAAREEQRGRAIARSLRRMPDKRS